MVKRRLYRELAAATRAAGELLARVASPVEAVDAMVVECALRRAATIATGNRDHLLALASGQSRRLDIIDL